MSKERGKVKSGCGGNSSDSSPFEEKMKGHCGKKEEVKESSCADLKKADETRGRGDQACVCGSSLSKSLLNKKKEKSQTKGKKRKCDSSQEAFKKSLKGEKVKGEECNSSYAEFLKERDSDKAPEKSSTGNQCADPYKKCSQAQTKEESCIDPLEDTAHSSKNGPCPKTFEDVVESSHTDRSQGCTSFSVKLKVNTTSKTTCNECYELPKKYVKHDICPEENVLEEVMDYCSNKTDESRGKKHPCPPVAEAGVTKVQKVTCPRLTAEQPSSNFFPLDARNKELNACVDKYMNVDPSRVMSKCSQYVSTNVVKSTECNEIDKKIQRECARPQHRRSSIPSSLGQSKNVQLLRRWGPSAAGFLAAATAALVWVTEWKEPFDIARRTIEGPPQPSENNSPSTTEDE